jgi:hypothetical protein
MSGSGMRRANHWGWYQSLDPECLPDLVDLTDEQLREALQTMLLHLLRVPSGSREVVRGRRPGPLRPYLSAARTPESHGQGTG